MKFSAFAWAPNLCELVASSETLVPQSHRTLGLLHAVLSFIAHVVFRSGSQGKVRNASECTVAPGKSGLQKPNGGIRFSLLCPCILPFQFPSKSVIVSVGPGSCGWLVSVQPSLHCSLNCKWWGSTWESPPCRSVTAASCSQERCWTRVGSMWGWQCYRKGRQPGGGRNTWRRPCVSPQLRASWR